MIENARRRRRAAGSGAARRLETRLAALVAALATAGAGAVPPPVAAAEGTRNLQVPRFEGTIVIDGRLDEPAWRRAATVALPYEVEPGDNTPAAAATECRVGYDAERFYFACEAHDPDPAAIRAFYATRDAADGQDDVGLVVDMHGDARRAYLFSVTALGVQGDARFDQQSGEFDDTWDAIWSAAGRRTGDGFVIEAAVPFRSVRFVAGAEGGWRYWFFRGRPRSEFAVYNSAPYDRSQACRLCGADRLYGIDGVAPGLDLELTPTLTTHRTDRAPAAGAPLAAGANESEAGIDLRFSPRPELAFNATWNPDFSQIEADVAQLDVNTQFALFFPEKRPFFLEGGDLFETPLRGFFSRTVVDPDWGAKASGRLGGSELAVLAADDESPQLLLPGPTGSRSVPLATAGSTAAARFRRAVGSGGSLGVLFTGREAGDYRSRLAGVDAFARPLPALTLRGQLLFSATRDPRALATELGRDAESSGSARHLEATYATRQWEGSLRWRALEPGFRADAGFEPQVDARGGELRLARLFWGDGAAPWTQIGIFGSVRRDETFTGELLAEAAVAELWIDGALQSGAWVQPHVERQRFAGETFDLRFVRGGARVRPSGRVALSLTATYGDAIDFAAARAARQERWAPAVELRLGRHVELDLSHDRQRLRHAGRELLAADLTELRARLHLTARASGRLVVQQQAIRREAAAGGASERRRERFVELLAAYELAPQRAVYLGYSEGREGSNELDPRRSPLLRTARTWFLKLGWAWRP